MNEIQYVDVTKYESTDSVGTKGKTKRRKERRFHLGRTLKKAVGGLVIGVFIGFGAYMVLTLSGITDRLASAEQLSGDMAQMKEDILAEVLQEQASVEAFAQQEKAPAKPEEIKQAETQTEAQEETQIPQMETVTAVVSDVTEVVKSAMPCVVAVTNFCTDIDWYGKESEVQVNGSGIIVGENEKELLIATNYHVVEDNNELTVTFIDDSDVTAYVKGTDAEQDLAVLCVLLEDIDEATKQQIAMATFGDSDALQVGEPAIAIGNSLGYGQSVTTGVISALNREVILEDETTSFLIQTDAAINPGNSGGALLNVKGEVIGINSNKIADYLIEGMGYAIPISSAKPVIEELMLRETRQKVKESERAFLGITGTDVTQEAQASYDMPAGVFVTETVEGSGAKNAGIRKGDIIIKLDGERITHMTQLQEMLEYYAGETTAEITFMRQDGQGYQEKTITVTLGYRTEAE